jgi:hypothetical protein
MAAILNYWILGLKRLLLLGVLPLLAGSLVAVQGWMWSQEASVFVENLRETEGRVLRTTPDGNDFLVYAEYFTEDGVRYEKDFKVDSRLEVEMRAAGKISLIYDRRFPQVVELGHVVSANNERLLFVGMAVTGLLLCLGGMVVLGMRARETAATLSLFRSGMLVQTEVRDSVLAPGQDTGRFTYAFRGPNGRWFDGKSPELPAAAMKEWPVGRRVVVAYDPIDPRQSEVDVFGVIEAKRRDGLLTA